MVYPIILKKTQILIIGMTVVQMAIVKLKMKMELRAMVFGMKVREQRAMALEI
jgi:hypothetical protein